MFAWFDSQNTVRLDQCNGRPEELGRPNLTLTRTLTDTSNPESKLALNHNPKSDPTLTLNPDPENVPNPNFNPCASAGPSRRSNPNPTPALATPAHLPGSGSDVLHNVGSQEEAQVIGVRVEGHRAADCGAHKTRESIADVHLRRRADCWRSRLCGVLPGGGDIADRAGISSRGAAYQL